MEQPKLVMKILTAAGKPLAGKWELSTTDTQRAIKEDLQREAPTPSTPTMNMNMLQKARKTVSIMAIFWLVRAIMGNKRNTVSRVLFWRRELTEPHWVSGLTRWVLRKTRWVRFAREKLTDLCPALGEGKKTHWARCLKPCSPKP